MKCPCCSGKTYEECCEPFIEKEIPAPTPETLMRSRYTAYSQANIDYIQKTMKGPALKNFSKAEAKQWAEAVTFTSLRVLTAYMNPKNNHVGFVEFIATSSANGKEHQQHELSEFHQEDGVWYYIDGIVPKQGRNDLCPCGSGKKYKKCCLS